MADSALLSSLPLITPPPIFSLANIVAGQVPEAHDSDEEVVRVAYNVSSW